MAMHLSQKILFFAMGVLTLASATTPAPISVSEELTFGKNVVHNNLGGVGPDGGEPTLVMANVTTTADGKLVDMIITASRNYVGNPRRNGVKGGVFGVINMISGISSDFHFALVDAETGDPVVMEKFYLTFFDLDAGRRKSRESVTLSNFASYWVPKYTELEIEERKDGTSFTASKKGVGSDNPKSPQTLNKLQMSRSVTVAYEDRSDFDVTYTVGGNGNARNLLFAGWSNLVEHSEPVVPKNATPRTTGAPCTSGCEPIKIKITVSCGGEPCNNATNATVTTAEKSSLLGRSRRHVNVTPHLSAPRNS
mmetsp:Transcript_25832/g.57015  ORF Transcript_25832/g.57015 Transcript_25832/m.57015 type:complete len:309 (+) Transcript_25832:79-1005(+)